MICFRCGRMGHKDENCAMYGGDKGGDGKEKTDSVPHGQHGDQGIRPEEAHGC